MKNIRIWLTVPLVLWVLNVMVAVVQHLIAGPHSVTPTFLQGVSTEMLMRWGLEHSVAEEWSVVILIGSGVMALFAAIISMQGESGEQRSSSDSVPR